MQKFFKFLALFSVCFKNFLNIFTEKNYFKSFSVFTIKSLQGLVKEKIKGTEKM